MASPNPSKRPLEEVDNVAESPKRSKQDEENLSDDQDQNSSDSNSGSESCSEDESSSESESSGSSSEAESDSGSESEEGTGIIESSKTPDLSTCPLRSLVHAYEDNTDYEDVNSYSPIHEELNSIQQSNLGPVDPVFVDEESSGEAVASAADQDDVEMMPPLPPNDGNDHEIPPPPLPADELQPPQPENGEVNEDVNQKLKCPFKPDHRLPCNENDQKVSNGANESEDIKSDDDDDAGSDTDETIPDEELMAILEKDIEEAKKVGAESAKVQHTERIKYKLKHKGSNHFDVMPNGWIEIPHVSGMPIYLHKFSRSVSLSRPYNIGKASARYHPIPVNAIPCLSYKKALEAEEEAIKEREKNVESIFPVAKVESAEENLKRVSLTPDQYREYCQKLFVIKAHPVKKFKSWSERRTHQRQERNQSIKEYKKSLSATGEDSEKCKQSRPALPDGTKIISIPVLDMEPEDPNAKDENNPLRQKIVKKSKKDWVLNPAGKSTVCILHEYLQHSIKKAPDYDYQELESSATPYSAVVKINGIEYGRGVGSSKKEAKSEAARKTLEIFIPEFKKYLTAKNGYVTKESHDLSFFEEVGVEDHRVPDLCNKMSEPSPYAILLSCLQRNYGLGDTNIKTDLKPSFRPKFSEFSMTVNEKTVKVLCRSKRDGKQSASQKLLQILHPNIKSWGSLLKLYGSHAIAAQKNKKEKESEVTGLQTGSGHTSPNVAILAKLRTEMHNLAERKKSCMGKLTLKPSLSIVLKTETNHSSNNIDYQSTSAINKNPIRTNNTKTEKNYCGEVHISNNLREWDCNPLFR